MSEFAFPYISELIGGINVAGDIPPLDDAKTLLELRELNTPERPAEEHVRALEAEFRKQNDYYDRILQDRKKNPRDDLATLLVQTEIDGAPLSDAEMRDALDLFMSAGFHTPAQFLATAVLYLSRLPELREQLTERPERIPDFIEELLRYDGPTHRLPRKLTRDIVLHGISIPKGATVSLVVAAANHDPAVFRDPEKFDIGRENNRQHMQFAVGPHTCIGMGMARAETRIALEIILPRIKTITLAPGHKPLYTGTLTTRGLRQLMVRFK
jgi:cytochrome P450